MSDDSRELPSGFSVVAVNVALAVLASSVALFALGLLLYVILVARPNFAQPAPAADPSDNLAKASAARLRGGNPMIRPIGDKSAVIDLEAQGLETNAIVPTTADGEKPPVVVSDPVVEAAASRQIEAELHADLERALDAPELPSAPPPPPSGNDISTASISTR